MYSWHWKTKQSRCYLKKVVSRNQKQETIMLNKPKLRERKSCRILKISRTGFRNRFKFFDKDLKERIQDLTYKHKNLSFTILTSGFRMKSPFYEQLSTKNSF